jgi:hypothetical protein
LLTTRRHSGFNGPALTYLIQNAKTREFFHQGKWTLDAKWAEEFPDCIKALAACLRHELSDVVLVLQFGLVAGRHCHLQLALPEQLLSVCGWPGLG